MILVFDFTKWDGFIMILSKSVYNFAKNLQINLSYLFIISGTILWPYMYPIKQCAVQSYKTYVYDEW